MYALCSALTNMFVPASQSRKTKERYKVSSGLFTVDPYFYYQSQAPSGILPFLEFVVLKFGFAMVLVPVCSHNFVFS